MSVASDTLPTLADVGLEGSWTITDQHGNTVELRGRFLGMGSSWRPRHRRHPEEEYAPRRHHCSTCRWREIYIFRSDAGRYLVVNRGPSIVPGETDYIEHTVLVTGYQVVEKLTSRRTDAEGKQTVELVFPATDALAQAAGFDTNIENAYINRATP
jgi:hypothetical protein